MNFSYLSKVFEKSNPSVGSSRTRMEKEVVMESLIFKDPFLRYVDFLTHQEVCYQVKPRG